MSLETGQAHTSTPKPSQSHSQRLGNFDGRNSNQPVVHWQSLAKTGMQEAAQQILEVEMRRTISVRVSGDQPGPARHYRCTSCSCWWDWSSLMPGRGARFRKSIFSWQLQPKIWHWMYWTRCRERGGSAEINWTNIEADKRLKLFTSLCDQPICCQDYFA